VVPLDAKSESIHVAPGDATGGGPSGAETKGKESFSPFTLRKEGDDVMNYFFLQSRSPFGTFRINSDMHPQQLIVGVLAANFFCITLAVFGCDEGYMDHCFPAAKRFDVLTSGCVSAAMLLLVQFALTLHVESTSDVGHTVGTMIAAKEAIVTHSKWTNMPILLHLCVLLCLEQIYGAPSGMFGAYLSTLLYLANSVSCLGTRVTTILAAAMIYIVCMFAAGRSDERYAKLLLICSFVGVALLHAYLQEKILYRLFRLMLHSRLAKHRTVAEMKLQHAALLSYLPPSLVPHLLAVTRSYKLPALTKRRRSSTSRGVRDRPPVSAASESKLNGSGGKQRSGSVFQDKKEGAKEQRQLGAMHQLSQGLITCRGYAVVILVKLLPLEECSMTLPDVTLTLTLKTLRP